jgi:hypothetical protein
MTDTAQLALDLPAAAPPQLRVLDIAEANASHCYADCGATPEFRLTYGSGGWRDYCAACLVVPYGVVPY